MITVHLNPYSRECIFLKPQYMTKLFTKNLNTFSTKVLYEYAIFVQNVSGNVWPLESRFGCTLIIYYVF